jgi:hypothetical protein
VKWPAALAPVIALLPGCGACQDINEPVDARPDPCAPEMQLTGEYVDWDSSATAFMGIFGATFTLEADPLKSTMTAPNGRFVMCIPADNGLVTVEPMAGSDYVAGQVVVSRMVVQSGALLSYRSFTTTRAADFGFDARLGQVYVHVHGGSRMVTTATPPGVKKIFDGTAWIDGTTGSDFYLGNIAGTSTTLVVSGGSSFGGGTVPLVPGRFTYVTIVAN